MVGASGFKPNGRLLSMRIEMATTDFNKYGFDLQFRMSKKESQREVALGKIGIVFIARVTVKRPYFFCLSGQSSSALKKGNRCEVPFGVLCDRTCQMNIPNQVIKTAAKSSTTEKPVVPFVPRLRAPNEAGPRLINVMKGTWVPHSMEPARASGNNHLAIKSLKP